jgi:pyruvate kinase
MLSAETAVGKHPARVVRAMAQVIEGAEKWQTSNRPDLQSLDLHFKRTDEAIAASVMYTANHLDVRAIVALTESGSTALWMSRMRSDIPIYAFTRHAATQRRVTLYRGVYPVDFDVTTPRPEKMYPAIFERMVADGLASEGDLIIVTKGEFSGVSGGTNTMKIIQVQQQP